MSYQEDIQKILDQALTEKTFSLDVIDRIKALRDAVVSQEAQNKQLLERVKTLEEDSRDWRDKYTSSVAVSTEWMKRSESVLEREKTADRMNYELEFQKKRADEIKEIVSLVFRNPVLKSQSYGNVPMRDNNGYISSQSTNESTEEHVE